MISIKWHNFTTVGEKIKPTLYTECHLSGLVGVCYAFQLSTPPIRCWDQHILTTFNNCFPNHNIHSVPPAIQASWFCTLFRHSSTKQATNTYGFNTLLLPNQTGSNSAVSENGRKPFQPCRPPPWWCLSPNTTTHFCNVVVNVIPLLWPIAASLVGKFVCPTPFPLVRTYPYQREHIIITLKEKQLKPKVRVMISFRGFSLRINMNDDAFEFVHNFKRLPNWGIGSLFSMWLPFSS